MNITIIGPRSVGKSTVSKLLATKLQFKYVESDDLMNIEMKKYGGLDSAIKSGKSEIIIKKGSKIVTRTLNKDKIVLDLAGGAISSTKGTQLGECQKIIETIQDKSIIIGILPFKNNIESINLLYNREKKRSHFKDVNQKELLIKVRKDYLKLKPILMKTSNYIAYTENRKPQSIAKEIYEKIYLG